MLTPPVSSKDHLQGDEKSPIVLVEYGDYQCPHCGHAYPIVKQIQKHYGKRLAFVFRNFPLNEAHPYAQAAAETAEFAGTKGKFWEMHDAIFENQMSLAVPMLVELAGSFDLSGEELVAALEKHEFTAHVKSDFISGVRSGVNGTPTFFINGHRHEGPFEFEDLVGSIDMRISRDEK